VALSIVSAAFFMNDENFKKNHFAFLSSSCDCFTKYGAMFDPLVFQVRFFPFPTFRSQPCPFIVPTFCSLHSEPCTTVDMKLVLLGMPLLLCQGPCNGEHGVSENRISAGWGMSAVPQQQGSAHPMTYDGSRS
jgi:hypothetical protein